MAGKSIYQNVSVAPIDGRSYNFSIWLRSDDGSGFNVTVELWATPFNQGLGTTLVVSNGWTLVTVTLDVAQGNDTQLRAQIYMNTTGHNLDLDGTTLNTGNWH